jgi:hypothetical protein
MGTRKRNFNEGLGDTARVAEAVPLSWEEDHMYSDRDTLTDDAVHYSQVDINLADAKDAELLLVDGRVNLRMFLPVAPIKEQDTLTKFLQSNIEDDFDRDKLGDEICELIFRAGIKTWLAARIK